MNPTPRVSQFPGTLRALAPRLLAAALFCSALPSQAKDPTGQEQGQAVPADCPSKGIINWSDSTRAKVGDHFWDYLSVKKGFGLGYGPWTKLSPAERCKIIKDNKDPANDAFRGYEYLLKTTDPAWYGMAKLEPEKQIEILDRLLPRIKKDRMEVFNTFGVRDPYRTRLEDREKELDNLKRLAEGKIQEKKATAAAKKITEDKTGSLKTVNEASKKIESAKGAGDKQTAVDKVFLGKTRKGQPRTNGSPGTRTSGDKVKVAADFTAGKVPGGDQNFATKYTGPGKQDPTKAPPTPMTDEQKRKGRIEKAAAAKPLYDITAPPGDTLGGKLKAWLPLSQAKETHGMLTTVPTEKEKAKLAEAEKYLADNTTTGKQMNEAFGEQSERYVKMNFAEMRGKHGAAIPLTTVKGEHADETHVSINAKEKDHPVEVLALKIGHEKGGHAVDNHRGTLQHKGSAIPSEYRAAVLDARNKREIEQNLTPASNDDEETKKSKLARLEEVRKHGAWQQADLKDKMASNQTIYPYGDFKDENVRKDAKAVNEFKDDYKKKYGTVPEPKLVMQFYIRKKYAKSGEEGMENLDARDDSEMGRFNKETDGIVRSLYKKQD